MVIQMPWYRHLLLPTQAGRRRKSLGWHYESDEEFSKKFAEFHKNPEWQILQKVTQLKVLGNLRKHEKSISILQIGVKQRFFHLAGFFCLLF